MQLQAHDFSPKTERQKPLGDNRCGRTSGVRSHIEDLRLDCRGLTNEEWEIGALKDPSSAVHQSRASADLENLMVRYQRAEGAATTAFIAAVSPLLYRFFLHQPGSREDASDLLQDTWLRIHKSRYSYRPGEPILPWLYAIARHVQIDGYRRRQRIRSGEQVMETIPESPNYVRFDAAGAPSFEALVNVLPESQREVLTMLKVTGMSLEEVARATTSSVGAVKQKAHRAYEKLRRILASTANANKESS